MVVAIRLLCLFLVASIYADERRAYQNLLREKRPARLVVATGEGVVDLNEGSYYDMNDNSDLFVENRVDDVWYKNHYDELTAGLVDIPLSSDMTSVLTLINNNTFAISTNKKSEPTTSGGVFGLGRFITFPRYEYMVKDFGASMTTFLENTVTWLAKGRKPVIATFDWTPVLGHSETKLNVKPEDLLLNSEINVYKVNAHGILSEKEIQGVYEYVQRGGGLLIGGQAWSYGGPATALPVSYPGNKLLAKMGCLIMDVDWQSRISPVVPMPQPESNLYNALLHPKSTLAMRIVSRQFSGAVNSYTVNEEAFQPLVEQVDDAYQKLDKDDIRAFSAGVAKFLPVLALDKQFDWSIVTKSNDVNNFPYDVSDDTPRVSKTITINGNYDGYPYQFIYANAGKSLLVSTGIYCKAGSTVQIKFPQQVLNKIQVTIGAHSDTLFGYSNPRRAPQIVFQFKVYDTDQTFGNPWGGLLYITIPVGSKLGDFDVTISNGIQAPYFKLGETTNEEWNSGIRNAPAPWAEVEAPGMMILTIQSSSVRKVEDMEKVAKLWHKIMTEMNNFAGFPNGTRQRTERIVADKEISAGYMHSGYPLMAHLDMSDNSLNADQISETGSWGAFHEIGHNHQHSSYTIGKTTETGCNFWAVDLTVKLTGNRYGHPGLKYTKERLRDWIKNGKPFSEWKVWLALDSYTILADEYGWDTFPSMFKQYYEMANVDGDDHKLDTWARMMSQLVNRDLCGYFEWFKFPLSLATRGICATLPKPETDILSQYISE